MSYAVLADLIARAGHVEILQVADRDGLGVPDPDVIAAALADADSTINGYVRVKYALPLPGTPRLLNTWAVSIARYVLHRDGAPDHVTADYKDAIAGLKDVARGLITLPDAAGETPAEVAGTHVAASPREVFTRTHLRGWR
ncbi:MULTISPECIES: gp436 family protein [Rhodovulum]|uniref:DUF1320 domain-containing protein n=2 Tax=Rhodovulum TaxID=34008 RepID=A0A844B8E7_9RHOB|nr:MULTISPECIES: DUF1320 domain-containing protein [Rhodovulum]MRH22656.1 DUF1320 domain-containing protein [Rhodovulum strictum]TCM84784.1 phage gp36-like protein [Rhodovulum steppense]